MNIDKIRSMLGFAIKANRIILGYDKIETHKKQISLILAGNDLSDRGKSSLKNLAEEKRAKLLILDIKLEELVHKKGCKVVAVLDKNMSDNIIINAGEAAEGN